MVAGVKLTTEDVNARLAEFGSYLLSEYKNCKTPVKVACCHEDCRKEVVIKITSLNCFQSIECKECKRKYVSKYSQSDVEKIFASQGCKLVSEYRMTDELVKYICSCSIETGEISEVTLYQFIEGQRCSKCLSERIGKRVSNAKLGIENKSTKINLQELDLEGNGKKSSIGVKITEDIINAKLAQKGNCKIGEYKNATTPFEVTCSTPECKNTLSIRWGSMPKEIKCEECRKKFCSKYTQEEVEKIFSDQNCILISIFRTVKEKLKYICSCSLDTKEISEIDLYSFKKGKSGCPKCISRKISEGVSNARTGQIYSQYFVISKLIEAGCTLLTEYKGCNEPFNFRCKCGKIGNTTWNHFKEGHRCGNCKKCTWEEALDIWKSYGFIIIQDKIDAEYVDSQIKLKCKCLNGHEQIKSWGNLKLGKRCRQCYHENNTGENHYKWLADRDDKLERRKFSNRCRSMVKRTYKEIGVMKDQRTFDILEYGGNDLRNHIKNHPNWKNVNPECFDIDHIFPIHAFIQYGIYDIPLINSLENLQPLTDIQNSEKGIKYDPYKFESWLLSKGYDFDDNHKLVKS